MNNPILEEIYEVRRMILAEHKDDLGEYLRTAFERAKASGHPVANIKQRSIRCTGPAVNAELNPDTSALPSAESPLQ